MKVVLESFLCFILILFISYISLGFIMANKQASTAVSFHQAAIDSIENSKYKGETIAGWQEKAEKYGFNMQVTNLSKLFVDEVIPCYYVSLTYKVNISLLGVNEESTIKGYAR